MKDKMKDKRKQTGQLGEEIALAYLLDQGYRLLTRNYQCSLGEVDLIVAKQDTLVFVEVRTRHGVRYGSPEESVSRTKRDRVRRVAQYYLKSYSNKDVPIRFDVVGIALGSQNEVVKLNHIQGAF
ncbi:MAG: YraN family protein [Syntrophomonadaceae bacterium]|nr:YraN family protein [Syntrophomonadaceae bacterium]